MKTLEKLDIPANINTELAAERKLNNTYRFNGPMPGVKDVRTRNKGIARKVKLIKRTQASIRSMPDSLNGRMMGSDPVGLGSNPDRAA